MGVSPKQNQERRFSDVKLREERGVRNWRSWFGGRSKTVNLKPPVYKRHPVFATTLVFLFVGISFFGLRRLFTRAEVADFYPSTCLGAWAGAQNAQGKPDMLSLSQISSENLGGQATFGENNSAIFTSGTGQIFCGGFVPSDYLAAGEIKSVGLTFVWQIGEPAATSSFLQRAQNIEQRAQNTEQTNAQTDSQTDTQTPPPENKSSTTSILHSPLYILHSLINSALAQTDSALQPNSGQASPQQVDPTSGDTVSPEQATTSIIGPPLEATLAPIVSSTEATNTEQGTQSTEQSAQVTPSAPDDNFLQVSYSTDGQTWVEIAKVNANNWQNFTVTLPVSNWDELNRLQIQIAGIPTTLNPTPKVYLDGMFAEAHYDLPPVFAGVLGGDSSGGAAPGSANGTVLVPAGIPVINLPPSQKPTPVNGQNTFKADEAPQFNLDLNSLVAPPPPPLSPPADSAQ